MDLTPAFAGTHIRQNHLRAWLRADHRLRHAKNRRPLENDRHARRRRHGHLEVGRDRRHRPALLYARGARRSRANTDEYFSRRRPNCCAAAPPATLTDGRRQMRDAEAAKPMPYEAGPPRYPMPEEAAHALMGEPKRKRTQSAASVDVEGHGQGDGSALRHPADHGRPL